MFTFRSEKIGGIICEKAVIKVWDFVKFCFAVRRFQFAKGLCVCG